MKKKKSNVSFVSFVSFKEKFVSFKEKVSVSKDKMNQLARDFVKNSNIDRLPLKWRCALFIGVAVLFLLILIFIFRLFSAPTLSFWGEVDAKVVDVAFPQAGIVAEIEVQAGQPSAQGDVLMKLDDARGLEQLNAAREKLVSVVERNLAMTPGHLSRTLAVAEADLAKAEAAKTAAETELEFQNLRLTAFKELFENGLLSEADFSHLPTAIQEAERNVREQELAIETAKAAVTELSASSALSADIDAGRQLTQTVSEEIVAAKELVAGTFLLAPFDGEVLQVNVKAGDEVLQGASAVSFADMRSVWVTIYVPVHDIRYVKEGQKAHISMEHAPNEILGGTVAEIGSAAQRVEISGGEVSAFSVKVNVDLENPSVKMGDSATVVLEPLS
jgi:multidrug resistance efflux pump